MMPAAPDEMRFAQMLRPVPHATGSCAWSQGGIEDDVPIGGGRFESIAAIAKLIRSDGRLVGWLYRTDKDNLVVQTVSPAINLRGPNAPVAREYSGYDPFHSLPAVRIVPCDREDFRNTRSHRRSESTPRRHGQSVSDFLYEDEVRRGGEGVPIGRSTGRGLE